MGQPNSFELDGRGPSDRQLVGFGLTVVMVVAALTAGLLAKSTGRLEDYVKVVADLVNVGDGLPQKSDVKYHGVLVGTVDSVVPAGNGKPNYVHIDLKPEYAKSIPAAVTARVVPSNVFAVSSVQLLGNGPGAIIQAGKHIPEDTRLPTVLFQTTVSKLRDLLSASGRGREDKSVGVLAAVAAATDHRRTILLHKAREVLGGLVLLAPGESIVAIEHGSNRILDGVVAAAAARDGETGTIRGPIGVGYIFEHIARSAPRHGSARERTNAAVAQQDRHFTRG